MKDYLNEIKERLKKNQEARQLNAIQGH